MLEAVKQKLLAIEKKWYDYISKSEKNLKLIRLILFALISILLILPMIDIYLNISIGIIYIFEDYMLLGTISLLLLLFTTYRHNIRYLVILALLLFCTTNPITALVIPLLFAYLIFIYFKNFRINRLEKIANMSINQLSKVKYEKPEVEIIIRGGGRNGK